MPRYRKKPIVVEAIQFGGVEGRSKALRWATYRRGSRALTTGTDKKGHYLLIETLEGTHRADEGDWIIQGVAGELYPCKPDIFEETYERENEND